MLGTSLPRRELLIPVSPLFAPRHCPQLRRRVGVSSLDCLTTPPASPRIRPRPKPAMQRSLPCRSDPLIEPRYIPGSVSSGSRRRAAGGQREDPNASVDSRITACTSA